MEGCGYRDLQDQFEALGVRIVGLSFDPPEKNAAFRERNKFRFELWTDDQRTLARFAGGAESPDAARAKRVTVVLDAAGNQVLDYQGVMNVVAHPGDVLHDCERVFGR